MATLEARIRAWEATMWQDQVIISMKGTKCHIFHTDMVVLVFISLHKYTPLILTGCRGRLWRPRDGKGRTQLIY